MLFQGTERLFVVKTPDEQLGMILVQRLRPKTHQIMFSGVSFWIQTAFNFLQANMFKTIGGNS